MRLINSILLSICSIALSVSAQGFQFSAQDNSGTSGWIGEGAKSGIIANKTSKQWIIDGVRITIPNKPSFSVTYPGDANVASVDDGNGSNRYDLRVVEKQNNFPANSSKSIPLALYQWGFTDDWTPIKEQYLSKIGSWASVKVEDSSIIQITQLDSLIRQPWFYDSTLYVPDSMGIRGGDSSGGFVDSWWDPKADTALWQIQIFPPNRTTKHGSLWNTPFHWDAGSMGSETNSGA